MSDDELRDPSDTPFNMEDFEGIDFGDLDADLERLLEAEGKIDDPRAEETPEEAAQESVETPTEGTGTAGRCLAVILSPIASANALSAALTMVGSTADVVPTRSGSAVFMDVPQEGTGDPEADEAAAMAALLGDERPLPDSVDQMARLVSKLARQGAVAITSWTSDSEAGVVGNMVARRYVNGEPEDALPSGLVLANLDLVLEELLLGRVSVEEVRAKRKGRWSGWLRGPGFRP